MSIVVDGNTISLIHVRHDGRSYGAPVADFDGLEDEMTKADLLSAAEDHFDFADGVLSGYELDITAETENATIRPQAKFG